MVQTYNKNPVGVRLQDAYYRGRYNGTNTYTVDDDLAGVCPLFIIERHSSGESAPEYVEDWHDDDPSEPIELGLPCTARISVTGDNDGNGQDSKLARNLRKIGVLAEVVEQFVDADTRRDVMAGDVGLSWSPDDVDELVAVLDAIFEDNVARLDVKVRDDKDESGINEVSGLIESEDAATDAADDETSDDGGDRSVSPEEAKERFA